MKRLLTARRIQAEILRNKLESKYKELSSFSSPLTYCVGGAIVRSSLSWLKFVYVAITDSNQLCFPVMPAIADALKRMNPRLTTIEATSAAGDIIFYNSDCLYKKAWDVFEDAMESCSAESILKNGK